MGILGHTTQSSVCVFMSEWLNSSSENWYKKVVDALKKKCDNQSIFSCSLKKTQCTFFIGVDFPSMY